MTRKNHVPTERSFGLSIGLVCAAISAFRLRHGIGTDGVGFAITAFALIVTGLFVPAALRVPNRVWSRFAKSLGWVNTRVLLSLLFFVVLTPVGFFLRLLGRNPLRPAEETTNWCAHRSRRADPAHYQHPF